MLTKHYASAIGFDIVFFLPDSEDDFANYTEFLRYLGSKNRAGVAKLDDGITLFLVPPSEFLTDVLKVPGRERLYGVVLKLPQQFPGGASAPQHMHQPLPPVTHMDRQLVPPTHEYINPKTDPAVHVDYARPTPLETGPPKAPFQTGSSQDQSNNGVSASKPGLTLTPELIATLASLLPGSGQPQVAQTSQPQVSTSSVSFPLPIPTNERPAFSQAWSQQPQMADPTGQSSQQFSCQMYPHGQQSATLQSFSANLSSGLPMQNSIYNLQEQGSVPSKAPTVHSATPQSQQFVPSSQASQPHHFEAPHNTQRGYGTVLGNSAGSYGGADVQQPKYPVPYTNQFQGANMSLPENVLPSSAGNMKTEPLNIAERNQSMPPGGGQSTDVEVVKNQRYQSTLQFAANLLLQIQQQQQQQQASSHMGNQQ